MSVSVTFYYTTDKPNTLNKTLHKRYSEKIDLHIPFTPNLSYIDISNTLLPFSNELNYVIISFQRGLAFDTEYYNYFITNYEQLTTEKTYYRFYLSRDLLTEYKDIIINKLNENNIYIDKVMNNYNSEVIETSIPFTCNYSVKTLEGNLLNNLYNDNNTYESTSPSYQLVDKQNFIVITTWVVNGTSPDLPLSEIENTSQLNDVLFQNNVNINKNIYIMRKQQWYDVIRPQLLYGNISNQEYISDVYEIPFNFDLTPYLLKDKGATYVTETIKAGSSVIDKVNTYYRLAYDFFDIPIGTFNFTSLSQIDNTLLNESKLYINLPFYTYVEINPIEVKNCIITINYLFNISNGKTTIIIYNLTKDYCITSIETDIIKSLPIIKTNEQDTRTQRALLQLNYNFTKTSNAINLGKSITNNTIQGTIGSLQSETGKTTEQLKGVGRQLQAGTSLAFDVVNFFNEKEYNANKYQLDKALIHSSMSASNTDTDLSSYSYYVINGYDLDFKAKLLYKNYLNINMYNEMNGRAYYNTTDNVNSLGKIWLSRNQNIIWSDKIFLEDNNKISQLLINGVYIE